MWAKVRGVPRFYRLSLSALFLLLPGLCAAGEAPAAPSLPLLQAVSLEFHQRHKSYLESSEAQYWFACDRLVNGYGSGAVVFVEANILVEAMLKTKIAQWMKEVGVHPYASADDVQERLLELHAPSTASSRQYADAILGLASAVHFVNKLSNVQIEEQMEIYGHGEHPVFQALSDLLSLSSDPDDAIESLIRLEDYEPNDAKLLTHFYNVILHVTGSSEIVPLRSFEAPRLTPVLAN